jgi:hypothetical protein
MSIRERKSPSSPPPHQFSELLPPVLTLHEAALRTGTTPEFLWEQVRSSQIPFTLVSGRRVDGSSILLHSEDLVRAGILKGQVAGAPPDLTPVRTYRRQFEPPRGPGRPAQLVWYGAAAAAAIVTALALVGAVPSVSPTSASKTITPVVSRSVDLSCKGKSSKECRVAASTRSRAPKGSTVRPGSQPQSASQSAPKSTEATGTSPGRGITLQPLSPASSLQEEAVPSPRSSDYSVPSKIPSNCVRDVTSDLNAWIRSVPNDSRLYFRSGACYRIDSTIWVKDRANLVIDGKGATFSGRRNQDGQARHWWILHSRGITLKNMIVRGANPHAGARSDAFVPKMQWQHAYYIKGSENVLLENVQGYDVYGDFVTIAPMMVKGVPLTSRNVTVRNSHFERNGRMGIAVGGGENIVIRSNYIGEVRHALLDLEPEWPDLSISNVRFIGNTTGKVWLVWFANGGVCNAGVSDITIAYNAMKAGTHGEYPAVWVRTPPGCARRGPFLIRGNSLLAHPGSYAAVELQKVHDAVVENNRISLLHDRRTRVLANLTEATNVFILDNTVTADPRDTVVFVKTDGRSDYISSGNRRI